MGTYSSLSVCVPNPDAFGQLLVERVVGVLKGFKLAQYDALNLQSGNVSYKERMEVPLQLLSCLTSRGPFPRFQKFTKPVFAFGGPVRRKAS